MPNEFSSTNLPVLIPDATSESTSSTTVLPMPDHEHDEANTLSYIFMFITASLILLAVVVLVSLVLRKRRIDRLRHHLVPLYSFDAMDDDQEWEAELLDEVSESHSLRRGYKSMEFPSVTKSSGSS